MVLDKLNRFDAVTVISKNEFTSLSNTLCVMITPVVLIVKSLVALPLILYVCHTAIYTQVSIHCLNSNHIGDISRVLND